jgi:hypothetical protein
MNTFDFIGWIGSVVMVAFSFTLIVPLAVLGLVLLTVQAVANRTYNLIALNAVSIVGFVSNLLGA